MSRESQIGAPEQLAQLRSRIAWQRMVMESDILCLSSTEIVDTARKVLREQRGITLTSAQERAVQDVLADMAGPAPMLRLLAGDVGSGKTLVALLALLAAAKDGYQGALMAPTSLLVEQHAATLRGLINALPGADRPTVRTLTSSAKAAERTAVYEGLADGSINIIVRADTPRPSPAP